MNRRSFLAKTAAAGLTLATVPIASTISALTPEHPSRIESEDSSFEISGYTVTEQDVLDLTLNYLDAWGEYLPHVDIREKFPTTSL